MQYCAVFLLAVLVVGAAADAAQLYADLTNPAGAAPAIDILQQELESTLTALYRLCRSDAVCSARFYLTPPGAAAGNTIAQLLIESDEAANMRKFFREIVFWSQQEMSPLARNSQRNRLTLGDYQPEDNSWWLTIMNTAEICPVGYEWELNRGCVLDSQRTTHDDLVHSHQKLDNRPPVAMVVAVAAFSLIILGAMATAVYYIKNLVAELLQKIDAAEKLWSGKIAKLPNQGASASIGSPIETGHMVAHMAMG